MQMHRNENEIADLSLDLSKSLVQLLLHKYLGLMCCEMNNFVLGHIRAICSIKLSIIVKAGLKNHQ